jgi:hypothetical protein
MGRHVDPVLFKHVKVDGAAIANAQQLERSGLEVSVPVKVEP